MKAKDYIEASAKEANRENFVEALRILEEGLAATGDPGVGRQLEELKEAVRHLKDLGAYKEFYESTQARDELGLLASLSYRLRLLTGRKTRKLVDLASHNVRYRRLEKDVRENGYRDICDIGCQDGRFDMALAAGNPGVNIVGVDIARVNVEEATRLNRFRNVRFMEGFAEEVDTLFKPGSFDLVMLFEILEHVIDVEAVLEAALKVLRDGGKVAVTVPTGFMYSEGREKEHVRAFDDAHIRKVFGHRKGFAHEKIVPRPEDLKYERQKEDYWNYITFLK